MKHTLFAAAALALMAVSAGAQTLPLTPERALDRRTIGELDLSADGSRLVFTVTEPAVGVLRARAVWLLDVASGAARPLTFSGRSDSTPRWAPDGRSIAFVSDRDGEPHLYRLSMNGGEAEKLEDEALQQQAMFRWSPDGAHIAVLVADPKSEALKKREKDKDDSRVADKDARRARVWLLDVATRKMTPVTSGGWQIAQIEWLPGGDRLIAAADRTPASDQWHEHLYSIALSDGAFTEVATPRGPLGTFALSPDGGTIAYVGARADGPDSHDLYLQPIAGGAAANLTATPIDRPVSQPRWVDAQTVAVHVARGFASAVALVGRDGSVRPIDGLEVNPSSFARTSSGTLLYAGETATRAPELWIKMPGTAARSVSTVNERWAAIPVIAPEMVKYKSADGTEIEAALLLPTTAAKPAQGRERGVDGGAPHLPAVVLVHGGPTGRWSDTFEAWGQLLAARGYAVLYPNVRGSVGYGHRFVEANRADWGGGDFKDVMAGADYLVARGIADPNRLGIGGWSYGGYMAAWAVTQTARFKAAVSGAPVIDMASEFGTEGGSAYDEWFYGTPYEKLDGFIKSSPITFVKNARTPTLLLQGEDDTTDPIGQSQQFYRGLKRYGVDAELVLYPREPHGLHEEKHLLDRLNRIVAWYDKYLMPKAAATAPQP
ncbi:MAG TPA: S9 family peptidase [Vicinamibacterales bacterium]